MLSDELHKLTSPDNIRMVTLGWVCWAWHLTRLPETYIRSFGRHIWKRLL
jgi:hypothetical protein